MITRAKIAIDQSGLKQIFIAKKLGLDNTLLSMYVTGSRKMPENVAKGLSRLLKVPIWNIVEREEEAK
jgi:hypothetical protein